VLAALVRFWGVTAELLDHVYGGARVEADAIRGHAHCDGLAIAEAMHSDAK
jgi:hypothetical protein